MLTITINAKVDPIFSKELRELALFIPHLSNADCFMTSTITTTTSVNSDKNDVLGELSGAASSSKWPLEAIEQSEFIYNGGLFISSPEDSQGDLRSSEDDGGGGLGALLRDVDGADRGVRRRLYGHLCAHLCGGARALHGRDLPRAAGRQILSGEVQRGE